MLAARTQLRQCRTVAFCLWHRWLAHRFPEDCHCRQLIDLEKQLVDLRGRLDAVHSEGRASRSGLYRARQIVSTGPARLTSPSVWRPPEATRQLTPCCVFLLDCTPKLAARGRESYALSQSISKNGACAFDLAFRRATSFVKILIATEDSKQQIVLRFNLLK
mgnify:CR=1 FL=1